MVGRGVVGHGLGEPALIFEVEVGPGGELGDRVGGEEVVARTLLRHLPRGVLDAVLADVERDPGIVGPRASGAVESADGVVHGQHQRQAEADFTLAEEDLGHRFRRTPPRRGVVVVLLRPGSVRRGAVAALARNVRHES